MTRDLRPYMKQSGEVVDEARLSEVLKALMRTQPAAYQAYVSKLKAHDWSFEYSDDGRVYNRGRTERNELINLQRQLDAGWELWNSFCPPGYEIGEAMQEAA